MENANNQLSKKERREQERVEWKSKEKKIKQKELARRVGIWGAIVLALVLMVWGLAKLGASNGPTIAGNLVDPVTTIDWIRGNKDAPVTLVEYSDLQCPACAAAEPSIEALTKEFGDKLRLVYRHYPLTIHQYSQNAARAAEAAGKQGKFWEMHDLLFKNQTTWSASNNIDDLFLSYAGALNLDKTKFAFDSKSSEIQKIIDASLASGNRSNVDSTPSFFLNGQKLILQNFDDLRIAVNDAVKKVK